MLKTLILLRLKGIFLSQVKSTKNKKATLGKIILIAVLFGYVGVVFLGMFGLLFYSLVEPFTMMDIEWLYFSLMGIMVIVICFMGSVFMTQNEIYNAKDNELLLAMPIKPSEILLSRLFTILMFNYIYEALIVLPAFVVYIIYGSMTFMQMIIFWIVVITLPLFVLALSSLGGWLLTHVLVRVKNRNFVSVIFYVLFLSGYLFIVNNIEVQLALLIQNGKSIAEAIEKSLFPIYHLGIAVTDVNIISLIIYLVCALVPFVIVIKLLSKNFVNLAIQKPKVTKTKYVQKDLKSSSMMKSLLIREWKHISSNAMVLMNGMIGSIFLLVSCVGIVFYKEQILETFGLLNVDPSLYMPLICVAIISQISTNIMSGAMISLEGDRLWILKSLPLTTLDILHSKLLFHILVTVVPSMMLLGVMSVMFGLNIIEIVMVIALVCGFVIFTGVLGILVNLWKPKFDYINEVICVKQSMATGVTMMVSMATFGAMVALFFLLVQYIPSHMIISIYIVVLILLDIALYHRLTHWGVKRFDEL